MSKKGGPSITSMHIAFGIASVLLLLFTVLAFVQDHFSREFPQYQAQYDELELKRLRAERQKAAEILASEDLQSELETIRAKANSAKESIASRQADLENAKKAMTEVDNKLQLGRRELNFMKADLDTMRYHVDIGKATKEQLTAQDQKVTEKFAQIKAWEAERAVAEQTKASIEADLKAAELDEKKLAGIEKDIDDKIKKKIGNPIINFVKDAPGLDIVDPRRKIEQKVLNNLPIDVFFAKSYRVDRCVSCHTGIMNPDPMYAPDNAESTVPRVLRAHPRLDLMVDNNSKHSYNMFGCTICHQGRPMGTTFNRSAHTPQNEKQAQEWREKYDWEPMHYWDAKMLPLQHTEASCLKCHKGLDEVPQAAKLNEGRHLFRDRGCANCHMGASGDKDMAWVGRVGPDLRKIGEKTNPDWARAWIYNPWDFRPTTKMPRFFGLENRQDLKLTVGGSELDRDPVEVEAISTYLFVTSKLRETVPPAPPEGDAANGGKLFTSVGCVACHNTEEKTGADKVVLTNHDYTHGPDLSRVGDKLSPGWLFAWLKNPRHYWAETKMPNLRLTDKEAADVTAYLVKTMRSGKTEKQGAAPEEAFDKIISDKLEATTPKVEIEKRLADPTKMMEDSLKAKVKIVRSADGVEKDSGEGEWTSAQIDKVKSLLASMPEPRRATKAFHAGETLIQHHGCFGCHNIQGWTYAALTCVNLNGEFDKDLDKFDFGHTLSGGIPNTKWDWFYNKIARPRVYDMGKLQIIKPYDRLRMPWFGYHKAAHGEAKEGEAAAHDAHGGHGAHGGGHDYTADGNEDKSPYGLTEHQVQRLVTHLISLTNEPIPAEMLKKPTKEEIALDRGHRVVRELNCNGCHLVGLNKKADDPFAEYPATIKMEALVAMLTPKGLAEARKPGQGVYLDEDIASIDYIPKDASGVPMKGIIHALKGTYLTPITTPFVLAEKRVTSNGADYETVGFRFEKKAPKKDEDDWVAYGSIVTAEQFKAMTLGLFYSEEKDADESYNRLKDQFVNKYAYERMAGTLALQTRKAGEEEVGVLSYLDVEKRKAAKKFFEPVALKVRLTRGEGRIIPHIVKFEEARGLEGPSPQQAPPSLSYEGGKVQPDWLYQFLHNVHTLRPGLNVRMPSFWTEGEYSKYKTIYPTGRLSSVDPQKRDKGIGGEPLPGPEAPKPAEMPDDAAQLVDFFITDAGVKTYGFQPQPAATEDDRKTYELGRKMVFLEGSKGGADCVTCHAVGAREVKELKWAPNLMHVKRRLKSDWVRRFLTQPQAIYPWTNMPVNFAFDWSKYTYNEKDPHRGILGSDEKAIGEQSQRLQAAQYYLMHAGEFEIGAEK